MAAGTKATSLTGKRKEKGAKHGPTGINTTECGEIINSMEMDNSITQRQGRQHLKSTGKERNGHGGK